MKRLIFISLAVLVALLIIAAAPQFKHVSPQQQVYWSPPQGFAPVADNWTPPPAYQWTAQAWAPPPGWPAPTEPWGPPAGWGEPQEWSPPGEF